MKPLTCLGVLCYTLTTKKHAELRRQRDKVLLPEAYYGQWTHHLPCRIYRLFTGQYFYDFKTGGYVFNNLEALQTFLERAAIKLKGTGKIRLLPGS